MTDPLLFIHMRLFRTILGPAIGPLVGGIVSQYLGWRWMFYIQSIMGGVISICNVLFLRETLYCPAGDSKEIHSWAKLKFNPVSVCMSIQVA